MRIRGIPDPNASQLQTLHGNAVKLTIVERSRESEISMDRSELGPISDQVHLNYTYLTANKISEIANCLT